MIFSYLKLESIVGLDFSPQEQVHQVSSAAEACSRLRSCMLYSWSWQDICIFLDYLATTTETNLLFKTHKMTVFRKASEDCVIHLSVQSSIS